MTAKNGKACVKCGTSAWDKWGHCVECHRQRKRCWRKANPEKSREITRRWDAANQDKLREAHRQWYKDNPEKRREHDRRWAAANPDAVRAKKQTYRARKVQAGGSFTAAEWKALCNHYGNKCLKCGRNDVKLTPDHIKPVSKGGSSNIDNIQPLCLSCNSAKKDRHMDYRPDAGPLRWLQCKLFG